LVTSSSPRPPARQ